MDQGLPELGPAPMDPAAYGADLDVEDLTDLLVRQSLDVAQHDGGAKLRGERGQGGRHVMVQSGIVQVLRRSREAAREPLLRAIRETVEAELLPSAGLTV